MILTLWLDVEHWQLELLDQVNNVDMVMRLIGYGGLISGVPIVISFRSLQPKAIKVQLEDANDASFL